MAGQPETGRMLALAGPTAVGKSEVALCLAELLSGEIISVDSMQVYRGLDIGTAKPSKEHRARVPHHLLDIVDIHQEFDVAQFVTLAHQAAQEIRARNKLPILCGGTGLYFKGFFDGLGPAPAGSRELRAALEAAPMPELLAELAAFDPCTYERIDRKNRRRVVRAVEVIRVTGKPYSSQRAVWSASSAGQNQTHVFGLMRSWDDLRERIDARVEEMFRRGLVAETRALLGTGLEQSRTAQLALGYRQVIEHLKGKHSLPETIALVKTRTKQFAKKQLTWFRRQLPVRWIEIPSSQSAEQTARNVLALFSRASPI